MSFDNEKLNKLLRLDESGWLDFKQTMYKVFDKKARDFDWQKGELVKDILALANGNTQSVGETAYLIIGAADQRNREGLRDLFDVDHFDLSKKQLIDWVKSYASPPIEELYPHFVTYQNTQLFIIEIPPSRYIHQIKKPLQVSKSKIYHANIVFMRIGEEITVADPQQIKSLENAKDKYFAQTQNVNPVWFGGAIGALILFILNWPAILQGLSDNPNAFQDSNQLLVQIILRLTGAAIGAFIGASLGYNLQQVKSFQRSWIRADRKNGL